jgi:membrane protein implicated in regulation of membrane protease activity
MLHWSSSAATPDDSWKVFLCIFLALVILAALSRHQWMHRLKRSQSNREVIDTQERFSSTTELD